MKLNTSVSFNGQCEAAFKLYEQRLGAKIEFLLRWGDSPMAESAPPGWADKIAHARLSLAGAEITAADVAPQDYRKPQGFSMLLGTDDVGEAERVFAALAAPHGGAGERHSRGSRTNRHPDLEPRAGQKRARSSSGTAAVLSKPRESSLSPSDFMSTLASRPMPTPRASAVA